jgi:beta-glucosidase-like glycosyl hydrolase/CubicO group peptidase (beta-lactamase class C family)
MGNFADVKRISIWAIALVFFLLGADVAPWWPLPQSGGQEAHAGIRHRPGYHRKKKKKKKKKKVRSNRKKGGKLVFKDPVERKAYPSVRWAKHVMADMTPEERIGQLFMVAAYSNRGKDHIDAVANLITQYKIGGLIFFQGGPMRQARLTNYYQSISKVPLFMAIDGEWGLGMRLDSTLSFPKQLTLGAIQTDSLIYAMGTHIAGQCERMGMHINFAPVIDINSNPLNPVIGFRSFGQDKNNVVNKGLAYMYGLQDNSIIACGKHFPGHGDTDVDSHKGLPVLPFGKIRLDSLELFPFRSLMDEGLMSVMVGHLHVPFHDTARYSAASISKPIVTNLLRDTLGFKGLVFTDALDMKGVSAFYSPGEVSLKALLAGNDVLLFPEDVPAAVKLIRQAVDSCIISQEEIDEHCYKILLAKQWAGLNNLEPIETNNLIEDLNSDQDQALIQKLYGSALTCLQNKNSLLPLRRLDTLRIASVCIGESEPSIFQQTLERYAPVSAYNLPSKSSPALRDSLLKSLENYNLVLFSVENTTRKADNNFNVVQETISFVQAVKQKSKVVLSLFGNPYALARFNGLDSLDAVLMPYEETDITEQLCAEAIFGAAATPGKLPVAVPPWFSMGTGISLPKTTRLQVVNPVSLNIESSKLKQIDSLVQRAISEKAFPGCQILAAKNGKVFYNKSFGSPTYDTKEKVTENSVYDLASITKVASTTLSLMQLFEAKKFKLDEPYSKYLPELAGSNKKDLTFREQLTHTGRLKPFVPVFLSTLDSTGPKASIYQRRPSPGFEIQVADSMYMQNAWADSLIARLTDSPLESSKHYLYSDVGYYYAKAFIEKETKTTLLNYTDRIYGRMGLPTMEYLPLRNIPPAHIMPTENDTRFRKQLLRGYVHDQGAAMLGGVAGHAGLFSNAFDLAALFQMYLNKGEYGGERYINKETVQEFIRCQFCNQGVRRGLGFDKPEPTMQKESPCSRMASHESFGHTGFTGTMVWADPANGLLFVFLSNRVNPDATNKKLIELSVRTRIQDLLYESIGVHKQH